jgi:cytoskeletal protein CcmA (bactofilin family)
MLFSKKPDDETVHDLAPTARPAVPKSAVPSTTQRPRAQTRSVIDPGLLITGTLEGDGDLQIDGQVRGDIRCTHLTVGSAATVDGNITADEVVVRGKVTGVIGGNRVMLMDSAHVESEIFHKRLSIEEGAYFEGEAHFNEQPIEKARNRPPEDQGETPRGGGGRREEQAAGGVVASASDKANGSDRGRAPEREPAVRRDEPAVARANGHHAAEAERVAAAASHAEADLSDIVVSSPPMAAPAKPSPRTARARAKTTELETPVPSVTAPDADAIESDLAAPSIKTATSEHDRLRARLRN